MASQTCGLHYQDSILLQAVDKADGEGVLQDREAVRDLDDAVGRGGVAEQHNENADPIMRNAGEDDGRNVNTAHGHDVPHGHGVDRRDIVGAGAMAPVDDTSKSRLQKQIWDNPWTMLSCVFTIATFVVFTIYSVVTTKSQIQTTRSQQYTIDSTVFNNCLIANQSGIHSDDCDDILRQSPPHGIILRAMKRSLDHASFVLRRGSLDGFSLGAPKRLLDHARLAICDPQEWQQPGSYSDYAFGFLLAFGFAVIRGTDDELRPLTRIMTFAFLVLAAGKEAAAKLCQDLGRPAGCQATSLAILVYTGFKWIMERERRYKYSFGKDARLNLAEEMWYATIVAVSSCFLFQDFFAAIEA